MDSPRAADAVATSTSNPSIANFSHFSAACLTSLSTASSTFASLCVPLSSSSITFKKSRRVPPTSSAPLNRPVLVPLSTPKPPPNASTGVFGIDFAFLCASSLDRALLTRAIAASVALPMSSKSRRFRSFTVGDARADCDIER